SRATRPRTGERERHERRAARQGLRARRGQILGPLRLSARRSVEHVPQIAERVTVLIRGVDRALREVVDHRRRRLAQMLVVRVDPPPQCTILGDVVPHGPSPRQMLTGSESAGESATGTAAAIAERISAFVRAPPRSMSRSAAWARSSSTFRPASGSVAASWTSGAFGAGSAFLAFPSTL